MPFCCINKIIYVPLQPFSRVFLIIMPYNIPLRQEHGMSIRPIEARSRIWLEKRPRRPGDGTADVTRMSPYSRCKASTQQRRDGKARKTTDNNPTRHKTTTYKEI